MKKVAWEHWLGAVGLALLATGSYIGLIVAPPERYMGEVGRILYIHVPTAWGALAALTGAFVSAVGLLWRRDPLPPAPSAPGSLRSQVARRRWGRRAPPAWDDALVACVEVGVLLTAMLLIQGSVWARPTWGVYWTWDPRLTTSAILLVAFIAVLGMRTFVDDPTRRAVWSAVATVVAYVDVPIVYFSIKWWRTLHQPFSTPDTIASPMKLPLHLNAAAMLLIATWLIARRARLARLHRMRSHRDEPAPAASALVAGD